MTIDFEQNPLGFILSRAYLAYSKASSRAMSNYDMTPEQYGTIHRLSLKDGISQKKLAELNSRDQTSTGKIIDKLEQKKLVVRAPDPADRRAVLLYLTAEGQALAKELEPILQLVHQQATAQIPEEELFQFVQVLNKISANLS